MSAQPLPDPILITRPAALQRLARELSRESIIAVDTESNSLYAYQERVCLIQFSTGEQDFLVDPLSLEDLSPLAPIFKSAQIEKVFHAAEYDLIWMERDFGFQFSNLFDTMVAARILGWDAIGLGSILEAEFGERVDKRFQRANWGQRPLPANLLSYARLDTHYLIALRDRLYGELEQPGRLPLAEEDFPRLCQANGRKDDNGPQDWWRFNGAHDLSAKNAAVLMELCRYRDNEARAADRPLFKVIGDKTLVAIAANCPKNEEQLSRIAGMSRLQINRHGKNLLAAVGARRLGSLGQPGLHRQSPAREKDVGWRYAPGRRHRRRRDRGARDDGGAAARRSRERPHAGPRPGGTPWDQDRSGLSPNEHRHV